MIKLSDFDAVIFDMDGVLIDSEPLWKDAMEATFQEIGCALTREQFAQTSGQRIDEVIQYWHHHVGWDGYTPKEVENRIIQRMIALIKENGKPLPGVIETLKELKAQGKLIGLGTSSYTVLMATVLQTLEIGDYFNFVHSAEYELYGKPHPAVYITVSKSLGINPLKCLVIEDSLQGVIAGKAAKMKVACIPEKTHKPEPKLILADYHYTSMTELHLEITQH